MPLIPHWKTVFQDYSNNTVENTNLSMSTERLQYLSTPMCYSPPVSLSSCPPQLLPSPCSSIISFPLVHVSASALTLSRRHIRSSMQTERDGSGGRTRKQDSYKTGPRLYLISSLLQPPPFLIPPSRRLQHLSAQVRPASICCGPSGCSPPFYFSLHLGCEEKKKKEKLAATVREKSPESSAASVCWRRKPRPRRFVLHREG